MGFIPDEPHLLFDFPGFFSLMLVIVIFY